MTGAAVAASVAAAACFGAASVLQHAGAARAPEWRAGDPRSLLRLGRQRPFQAGVALDGAGFVLSAWAIRVLPVFVVEAALASSLAVTALLAALVSGEALRRGERLAVIAAVGGLAFAAAAASPAGPHPARWTAGALVAGLPLVAAAALLLDRRPAGATGPVLAALSGTAFAGFALAARALGAGSRPALLADPLGWALAGYVVLGLHLYGGALRRSSATAATAACLAVESLLPSAVGVLALGDRARPGMAPAGAAGFVLATVASLVLARNEAPCISAAAPLIGSLDPGG
ncbi:MAG TPA: hypothetical protein VFJ85_17150 [Acidimicrobiales bacterium]|nr:hypothetical protein [Acidimicrobiales bacterium]